jgi:serine/threonine protein kinase
MIGTTVSHYKILEKLGEGGMGVVFKAEDLKLQRVVALKFLPHGLEAHEPERARFLQEARSAALLNHPNICTIHDIAEAEGQQFIVMEYVEGKTLGEKTQSGDRDRGSGIRVGEAIGYAIQIAEALQEAHSHGIVHRDVKADNIMVNMKDQVKVMDFGLAKLKGSMKLTKTSSTIGTLAYMAPEQIEGKEVDARSDIFSFGILLYEMLTGHLPFRGEHEAAMVYSIMNEEPESLQHYLPDAPSELLHILNRSLEKEREDRYQSVQDMLIDLRRLKKESTRVSRQSQFSPAVPDTTAPEPANEHREYRKNPRVIIGAFLVAIVAVGLAYLLARPSEVRLNPNRTQVTLKVPFKEILYHSISADGNWLTFPAKDQDGTWDVYLMNVPGGTFSRVTNEKSRYILGARISPDASLIAYTYYPPSGVCRVKAIPSQGGGSRTLSDTGMASWTTSEGSRISYGRVGAYGEIPSASGSLEIWSVRPDGADLRHEFIDSLTTRQPIAFSWAPDGASIAWIRNFSEGYGEVMTRHLATGRERQLTFDKKYVDEVFWTRNDVILFISNKSGQSNLWMVPAGGGGETQVTLGAVPIISGTISADNKKLVCLQQEKVGHYWISNIDGTDARQLTFDDMRLGLGRISPDGRQISCTIQDVDFANLADSRLYVMDRDGSNRKQLTSGSLNVLFNRWSPNGEWLAFSARKAEAPSNPSDVYLIRPLNPGPPRLIGKGESFMWIDSVRIAVYDGTKTFWYMMNGGGVSQIGEDSTYTLPGPENTGLLFRDYRKGREGWWATSAKVSGRRKGSETMILSADAFVKLSMDRRYFLENTPTGEIWRIWVVNGKKELVGKIQGTLQDVSADGREILCVREEARSRLVLINDPFR